MNGAKIINKNEGAKIDYEIIGNKIIFNDELMLNLAKYERDDPMHIDICMDEFGCLCMRYQTFKCLRTKWHIHTS